MNPLLLTIFVIFTSCAGPRSRYVKAPSHQDASDVIVLVNPYQEALERELSSNEKISAHTVYDSEKKIAGAKKQMESSLLNKISGDFEITAVRPGEDLTDVSRRLYGTVDMWKRLFAWNQGQLPAPNRAKPGMKLRYIPGELLSRSGVSVPGPLNPVKSTGSQQVHRSPAATEQFKTYIVKPNQTLEMIAEHLLGERKAWHKLVEWNRDRLSGTAAPVPGMQLRYLKP